MAAVYHSFDVFDTCLVRSVAEPADMFYLLGSAALESSGLPCGERDVLVAANVRLRAEQSARRTLSSGREDLGLADIYAALPGVDPFGLDAGRMMALELKLERDSLCPVPGVRRRIERLRRDGARILFISDMYLPADFIKERLVEHGVALERDRVYASGDIGKTKHTGALFRHVLDELGLKPGQLVHHGDNVRSDRDVPRSLGIGTELLTDARLGRREHCIRHLEPRFVPETSRMAGAARLCRLGAPAPSPLAEQASGVVAPVLVSFVRWVLWKAQANGWKRLYFVSRDGQILLRAALALPESERKGIDCRYLYGSRQAWFLASLKEFDFSRERSWLVVPGHSASPVDVLKKLNIRPEDLKDLPHGPPFSDAAWQAQPGGGIAPWFEELLGSSGFKAIAEAKAAEARSSCRAYLRQEGLLDGEKVVLVDIGWTLKSQKALRGCLEPDCPPDGLHGVYFGVQAAHVPDSELGAWHAYFVEQPRHFDRLERLNPIFRNANCIEQVFTAGDHGQVRGYRETGQGVEPLLGPPPSEESLATISLFQEQVVRYAKILTGQPSVGWRHELVREQCAGLLLDFLKTPEYSEAAALRALSVFDDQNESRSRPLCRAIGLGTLARLFFPEVFGTSMEYRQGVDWLEGSVALSHPLLRPLLRRPVVFERLRKMRIAS